MNQAKHARIVCKARKLRLFIRFMDRKMRDNHYRTQEAIADFFDYTPGYVSQLMSKIRQAKKNENVPVPGEFAATICYLVGVNFYTFFDIEPAEDYFPKAKYRRFREKN